MNVHSNDHDDTVAARDDVADSIVGCDPDGPHDIDARGHADDPFDSFQEGVPVAHHVITPALLAGLSGAPVALCRAFHRALFDLLHAVGGLDGLIVTPAALVGPSGSTKWTGAFAWLRTSPAPDADALYDEHIRAGYEPDEASDHVEHTVMHHSLDLAAALGTNPSATYASLPALSHSLLVMIASRISRGDVKHIDVLTDVAIAMLAITSLECRLEGGARVVDTGALLHHAEEAAASA